MKSFEWLLESNSEILSNEQFDKISEAFIENVLHQERSVDPNHWRTPKEILESRYHQIKLFIDSIDVNITSYFIPVRDSKEFPGRFHDALANYLNIDSYINALTHLNEKYKIGFDKQKLRDLNNDDKAYKKVYEAVIQNIQLFLGGDTSNCTNIIVEHYNNFYIKLSESIIDPSAFQELIVARYFQLLGVMEIMNKTFECYNKNPVTFQYPPINVLQKNILKALKRSHIEGFTTQYNYEKNDNLIDRLSNLINGLVNLFKIEQQLETSEQCINSSPALFKSEKQEVPVGSTPALLNVIIYLTVNCRIQHYTTYLPFFLLYRFFQSHQPELAPSFEQLIAKIIPKNDIREQLNLKLESFECKINSKSFTPDDLSDLISFLQQHDIINRFFVFDSELEKMHRKRMDERYLEQVQPSKDSLILNSRPPTQYPAISSTGGIEIHKRHLKETQRLIDFLIENNPTKEIAVLLNKMKLNLAEEFKLFEKDHPEPPEMHNSDAMEIDTPPEDMEREPESNNSGLSHGK